jgi:tetratricopeptide (TPR) repeat protein
MIQRHVFLVAALFFALILSACSFSQNYFVAGLGSQKAVVSRMFRNVEDTTVGAERRFVYIQEIIKALRSKNQTTKLNLFLTDYVGRHKKDVYDAYYLFIVAENYLSSNSIPFAVHYFDRILENYPDLLVHGTSIHFLCLSRLIRIVKDPRQRATYYKELISRFGDKIQTGPTYYHLGKTYAELGEWDLEIQAYKNFLSSPTPTVSNVPDARSQIRYLIDMYDYPKKSWAMSSLNSLVDAIRSAISSRNTRLLARYRAKVGFFARSWESETMPVDPAFLNDFDVFMNPQVHASNTLDIDSNSQEAYLQTKGWSYRIETWYLYFRKIDFPEDPTVQGKWEWAGIYFGEKPFSGAGGA